MQRDNCIPEKYCYGDNSANCTTKRRLYQWDEMMKFDNASGAQGFCPPGWHVPTESQWGTLFNYYISNGFAGSPLKYTGYSGFNAYLEWCNVHEYQLELQQFRNYVLVIHPPRQF